MSRVSSALSSEVSADSHLMMHSALQPDEYEGSGIEFTFQQAAIYLEEGQGNDKFDTHPSTPDKIRQCV